MTSHACGAAAESLRSSRCVNLNDYIYTPAAIYALCVSIYIVDYITLYYIVYTSSVETIYL